MRISVNWCSFDYVPGSRESLRLIQMQQSYSILDFEIVGKKPMEIVLNFLFLI